MDHKAQTAIEFMTVYGFVFVIIGIIIVAIIFYFNVPKNEIQPSCTSFGGMNCQNVEVYANATATTVSVLLSNSQDTPINITGFSAGIGTGSSFTTGSCDRDLLYPGQEAICTSELNVVINDYILARGVYSIKAQLCSAGVNMLPHCTSSNENATFTGSFFATSTPSQSLLPEVYCVGGSSSGLSDSVYYSYISQSGITSWKSTTPYPINDLAMPCVVSEGYIYCSGGNNGQGSPYTYSNTVYYASISHSGLGAWEYTANYPLEDGYQSCTTQNGYFFCVAGNANGIFANAAYYAPISSSGAVQWSFTGNYPKALSSEACANYGGYIYCIGGNSGVPGINSVYYASLSSGGIGAWIAANAYPVPIGENNNPCAASNGNIYCIGGNNYIGSGSTTYDYAYYAPISGGNIGQWQATNSYPITVWGNSCVSAYNNIYCIGGNDGSGNVNSVYYSPILSSGALETWQPTSNMPVANGYPSCVVSYSA